MIEAERSEAWIQKSLDLPGNNSFSELIRLKMDRDVNAEILLKKLDMIDAREDCADFQLAGFIRMLYLFPDSSHIPIPVKERIKHSILNFKYWPDEPGIDGLCTWTENHTILFASAAYLAGQFYPDEIFVNSGRSGREMVERFKPRIDIWLSLRFKTGFSEWLSNVYYNEDFPAVFNLLDFAEDSEIRMHSEMIIDLMLADMSLNSYKGIFASSHGRSYESHKKYPERESTAPIAGILWGGECFQEGNFSAVSFLLSDYKMPQVFDEMFHKQGEQINRQNCGFAVEDIKSLGLDMNNPDHIMMVLATEAYMHPQVIPYFLKLLNRWNWWENRFFKPLKPFRRQLNILKAIGLLKPFARLFEKDLTRGYRGKAAIYSYRTDYYMMSSAPDYRPGYGGDQQSPWQVTMGGRATCFITHPGKENSQKEADSPNYWTGSGTLPSVAQHKNCAILIFNINTSPGVYVTNRQKMTHAWFPCADFDQVREEGNWIFAAKGDAYLGLWSRQALEWGEEGDGRSDLIARGKKNIWICQAGSRQNDRSFEEFITLLLSANLITSGQKIHFESPGNGTLEYAWKGTLRRNGSPIKSAHNYRYKNSFVNSTYPSEKIRFYGKKSALTLNYSIKERIVEN